MADLTRRELLTGLGPIAVVATGYWSVGSYESYKSPLTEAEELASSSNILHTMRWPGGATPGEGLANLIGHSTWPPSQLQYGLDFGPRTTAAAMAAGKTHPGWVDSGGGRLLVRPLRASRFRNDPLIERLDIQGSIDVNVSLRDRLLVRDCIVRGPQLNGIQQNNKGRLDVERCLVTHHKNRSINIQHGSIVRCKMEMTGADIVGIGGTGEKTIDLCYFENPAHMSVASPRAHGDVLQSTGGNLSLTRSVLYMPAKSSIYYSGSIGATNALRWCDGRGDMTELYVLGCILAGGGYTVEISSRHKTSVVGNVLIANNIIGGPAYRAYGEILVRPPVGQCYNIAFFNNRREDGTPALGPGGMDHTGIWNFDSSRMSPKFRYLAMKLGLLDAAGAIRPIYDRTRNSRSRQSPSPHQL